MSHTYADGQIQCPYSESHVVSSLRAIPHLTKCRLQHPELMEKVGICRYNEAHHVPVGEMERHLDLECEDYKNAQIHEVRQPPKGKQGASHQQQQKQEKVKVAEVSQEELDEWT